ncbi:uncharacterized protein LOC143023773 [Oratosquilla oratoria]|uniref:uncharacterized protein LOC143023773 n=1 Tax=Oratosquilla oratoria TaxID=337810 RepID=UPI003F76D36B
MGRVLDQGGISEPFAITGGLKQGCVLAPTLFSLYTAAMINEIPQDAPAVDGHYRLDRGLFKLPDYARPPRHATLVANAQIGDHPVENVDNFTYLGSILSRTVTCEKDIENRIKAAHSAYGRLAHRVFTNHRHTKIMVFRAVVLSTLLYACEPGPSTNATLNALRVSNSPSSGISSTSTGRIV